MATRKLIIAALCCGLAILLAGGLWLVASGKEDAKTSPLLEAGQQAKVGGLDVTTMGGALDGQELVLTVEGVVPEGSSAVDDFAAGWSVLSPTGAKLIRAADREVALDVPPCSTARIEPGATVQCFMVFTLESPQTAVAGFTTVYSRDHDLAAWLLQ